MQKLRHKLSLRSKLSHILSQQLIFKLSNKLSHMLSQKLSHQLNHKLSSKLSQVLTHNLGSATYPLGSTQIKLSKQADPDD